MPRFAVRQHDSLRTATGRRHHLNLLLHDHDEENSKTYGERAPGLLSGTKLRHFPSQTTAETHSMAGSPSSKSSRYPHQLPSLTEQALDMTHGAKLQHGSTDTLGVARGAAYAPELLQADSPSSTFRTTPSWLTPQQLHNRQSGMKVAKMMRSHRTPIGAFANFDMPVAP